MNFSDFLQNLKKIPSQLKIKRLRNLHKTWQQACAEIYPEPLGLLSTVTFRPLFGWTTNVYYSTPGYEVQIGKITPFYTHVSRRGVAMAWLASKGILLTQRNITLHSARITAKIPCITSIQHDSHEQMIAIHYVLDKPTTHVFSIRKFDFLLNDVLSLLGDYLCKQL